MMPTLDDLQAAVTAAQDKPGADKINAAWTRVLNAHDNVQNVLADTAARNEANEKQAGLRKHAAELEAELAAVKAEMRPAKTTAVAAPAVDTDAVREWATEQGMTVAIRGRLSRTVIDAYNAAHTERELVSA